MVFTVRVRRADHGLSRRAVLAGAIGGATALGLGACGILPATAVWHPAPDALLSFLVATQKLADTYDAAMRVQPALADELTPLRDAHRAHVTALRRELGLVGAPLPTPPPTTAAPAPGGSSGTTGSGAPGTSPGPAQPSTTGTPAGTPENDALPSDRAALIGVLRTAERRGHDDAVTACLSAPSYRAALLGSIAACRAAHAAVLA